jgi:hypothetical protein
LGFFAAPGFLLQQSEQRIFCAASNTAEDFARSGVVPDAQDKKLATCVS